MPTKVVSYSELDTYRQCRLKHQLSYREKWRTEEEAPALTRGTRFHSVMEAHYKKLKQLREEEGPGMEPHDVHEDLFLAVAPHLHDGNGGQTEEMELVEWLYRGYVDLYDIDTDWVVEHVEFPLEEWLPNEKGNRTSFKLAGTVDLVVRDLSMSGGLWIVDHKTCANLPKQKDFDMEDQTALYTYLLKRAGHDIRGAIYNHCRTKKLVREMTPEERFKRTVTVRTDRELETMALEALDTMKEAYAKKIERQVPVLEYPGGVKRVPIDLPRTPDGERCGWKCGFTEACLAGRKSGPAKTRSFLADTGFTQHDTKPGPTFNKEKAA